MNLDIDIPQSPSQAVVYIPVYITDCGISTCKLNNLSKEDENPAYTTVEYGTLYL